MLDKILYVFLAIAIITGVARLFINNAEAPLDEQVACTMDAMLCPDGTYVGRSGPKCEFDCSAPSSVVPSELETSIDAKADMIKLTNPAPGGVIESGVTIRGEAHGSWFFEASFPVILTNWNGLIIAEGFATAEGDWMTTEFVPFSTTLEFTNPFTEGSQEFVQKGTLILKKDNPSGLPEMDDSLEIPVRFAP